jgi:hypothetical protein
MKKTILNLVLLSLLASGSAFAATNATMRELDYLNSKALTHEKKINLRVYVPGLLIGWAGGAVDLRVNPALTVGPTLKYFAYGSHTGFEGGVLMNYALNGEVFSSGWLLNPYAEYYQSNYNSRKQETSGVFGANLMYQWMWDNGINLQLGGGLAYTTLKLPLGIGGSENLHPNFDFTLGYSF